MNQVRPVNLNLFTIRFPLPAIVSILHRISGACLFLLTPFLIWLLGYSLTVQGFETLQNYFHQSYIHVLVWLLLAPLVFHFVAGIRHLLMDIHIGSSKAGGKFSALLTFIISAVLLLLIGIWLW